MKAVGVVEEVGRSYVRACGVRANNVDKASKNGRQTFHRKKSPEASEFGKMGGTGVDGSSTEALNDAGGESVPRFMKVEGHMEGYKVLGS